MNSVGTSPMDWFYKEKQSVEPKQSPLSEIGAYASQPLSTASHKYTGDKANVFELMGFIIQRSES